MKTNGMRVLVFLLLFLNACSKGSSKSGQDSSDLGAGQKNLQKISRLRMLETEALTQVAQVDESDISTHFRFKTPEAREEASRILLSRFKKLGPVDAIPADKIKPLMALFWNLVESTARESRNPVELRTLLDELSKNKKSPFFLPTRMVRSQLFRDNSALPQATGGAEELIRELLAIPRIDDQDSSIQRKYYIQYQTEALRNAIASATEPRERSQYLKGISQLDPEVARELFKEILFREKLSTMPRITPSYSPIPQMQWSFDANFTAGRCGEVSDRISGAQIRDYSKGMGCQYGDDGVNSNASVVLHSVDTRQVFERTVFQADISSYVKGGWRHGGIFRSPPEEDETSSVRYFLHGTAVIPPCSDLSKCHPVLTLLARASAVSGGKIEVQVRSPALGGAVSLALDQPFRIDRTEHPIEVTVRVSREFQHLGSYGEPPAQRQMIWIDLDGDQRSNFEPTAGYYFHQLLRGIDSWKMGIDGSVLGTSFLGETLVGLSHARFAGARLEDRFRFEYNELWLISELLRSTQVAIPAQERKILELAREQISSHLCTRWAAAIQALRRDRVTLLGTLPTLKVSEELSRLLDSVTINDEDDDLEIQSTWVNVEKLLDHSVAQDPMRIQKSVEEVRNGKKDRLRTVSRLQEIQADLLDLEERWKNELTLFTAELNQLQDGVSCVR